MFNKKILFIYNPVSGKGLIKNHLAEIINYISKSNYQIEVYPTKSREDATKKIINIDNNGEIESYDKIICSGGDGTLNEVISGMSKVKRSRRIPIGYIPLGSTNDFAYTMGIPRNIKHATINALTGRNYKVDLGHMGNKTFVYVAAFGIFSEVPYGTDQNIKNILGRLAYILEGAASLSNVKKYHLKIKSDELSIEDDFLFGMITNTTTIGGFKNIIKRKDVKFNDGKFEVTLIKYPKNILDLNKIIKAITLKNYSTQYMFRFSTSNLLISSHDTISYDLDGEYGGDYKDVNFFVERKGIKIVIPRKSKKSIKDKRKYILGVFHEKNRRIFWKKCI